MFDPVELFLVVIPGGFPGSEEISGIKSEGHGSKDPT
jgi:hypothetical protein